MPASSGCAAVATISVSEINNDEEISLEPILIHSTLGLGDPKTLHLRMNEWPFLATTSSGVIFAVAGTKTTLTTRTSFQERNNGNARKSRYDGECQRRK